MDPLISIPFTYNQKWYQMLMRRRRRDDRLLLRVTVMNGELEKMLHGYSEFEYDEGNIAAASKDVPEEIVNLQIAIIEALYKYCSEQPMEALSAYQY